MRLLSILLLILLLGSCQQRYFHVKKVKANPHRQSEKTSISEHIPDPAKLADTLVLSKNSIPETSWSIAVPENKVQEIATPLFSKIPVSKSSPPFKIAPKKYKKAPEKESASNNEPLTFRERLFIFSTFVFWFLLVLLMVAFISFIGLWLAIVLSGSAIILAMISIGTILISWLAAEFYMKAEEMVGDRIGTKMAGVHTGIYWFLAISLTLTFVVLVMIFASNPWAITLISLYLLGIVLYTFTYKKV